MSKVQRKQWKMNRMKSPLFNGVSKTSEMNITVLFISHLEEVSIKQMISLKIGCSILGRMSIKKSGLKIYAAKFVMMGLIVICINSKEEMILSLEIISLKILKSSKIKKKLFL